MNMIPSQVTPPVQQEAGQPRDPRTQRKDAAKILIFTGLLLVNNVFFLAVAVLACTPILPFLKQRMEVLAEREPAWRSLCNGIEAVAPALLLFLSFLSLE